MLTGPTAEGHQWLQYMSQIENRTGTTEEPVKNTLRAGTKHCDYMQKEIPMNEPRTYHNPVQRGFFPDPSVTVSVTIITW